jgi:hypothetical protein
MRKILRFHGVAVADDVTAMNNLIYTQGAFAGGVFAGDTFITSYWGLSILLNNGGWANGNGAGNNGRSYDAPFTSFTINMRDSGSSTLNKSLFTIRPDGSCFITGLTRRAEPTCVQQCVRGVSGPRLGTQAVLRNDTMIC